ncbi:hypothetical protein AB205_0205760 [Aquarana catesbeiana]|uniref:Uncharacterized protein n=1 Tax=Aquarana catesbeiana TaxID=8400 RepID=A0A2G9QBI2_AQUCT|nr:hypothetical protein AB205_0205760 [Aquarana catesbeiana]
MMVRPQIEGAGSVQKNQECCKKGRKDSGHLRTPGTPHLLKKGKSPHHKQRMRRERFMKWVKLSPQQVTVGDHSFR